MKCSAEIAGKFPPNLKSHLKGNHPAAYTEMMGKEAEKQKEKEATLAAKKRKPLALPPSGQLTLEGSIQKAKPYSKDSPRYKSISRKLTAFVATGNIVVECESFCELL